MKKEYIIPELTWIAVEARDVMSGSGMSCAQGDADFHDERIQKYNVPNDFWS